MANQQLGFDIVGKSNASEVMGKAGKEADKLAAKLKKAFDIKGALVNAFIGAFGAAVLLDKSIQMISDSFTEMGNIGKEASKSGLSAVELDKLSYAAGLANVSTSALAEGIKVLKANLKDAQKDVTKMHNLTAGLGYTEAEVRSGNIKNIDALMRVAIAMKQAGSDAEKAGIATAFFGDKAQSMIPLLDYIANNPSVFSGLVTGSEEAYTKLDKINDKLDKLYHNAKRLIGFNIFSAIQANEEMQLKGKSGALLTASPQLDMVSKALAIFSSAGNGADPAKLAELNKKVNANEVKTTQSKNDNTIAGSLGAPVNAPASGVIGIGNNAVNLIMEEQLDTLKQIKQSIDNLGPNPGTKSDFTKPEIYTA